MANKLNIPAINLPAPFAAGSCDPIDARIIVETKSDITTNAATTFGTVNNIYCKIYEGIIVYISDEQNSYMYVGPAVVGDGILLSEVQKDSNWIKVTTSKDIEPFATKLELSDAILGVDVTEQLKEYAKTSDVEEATTELRNDLNTVSLDLTNHKADKDKKHIPEGGEEGQILKWKSDGTAKWDTLSPATPTEDGLMSSTDKSKLDGIEAGALVNTITGVKGDAESTYRVGNINITKTNIGLGNVTNDALVKRSEMGVANGVATLDSSGKVPSDQLPSYVDDIIDVYATYDISSTGDLSNVVLYLDSEHTQSVVGESGKIYQNITEGQPSYQFRWTGTVFAQTGASSLILGEVTGTAYDGAKGKENADNINKIKSTSLSVIGNLLTYPASVAINYATFRGELYGSGSGDYKNLTFYGATQEKAGVMTAADKTKLDNLKSPLLIMNKLDFEALENKDSSVLYIVR